jgi:hypothetical protein
LERGRAISGNIQNESEMYPCDLNQWLADRLAVWCRRTASQLVLVNADLVERSFPRLHLKTDGPENRCDPLNRSDQSVIYEEGQC